jgi:gliding-associated putative ABC transporter substrate-binding component GldG
MKKRKSIASQLILIVVALVLLNIISERFFLRLDFTEDRIYTLSNATKDILRSLDEPVTVTAYFTKDNQPEIEKTRKDFKDLLIEYSSVSGGMVNYEFIDPTKDEQTEQEAMQSGIQPLILNVREKDQVKQQKVYLGAKIQLGEQTDIIPVIQPGAAMEYALSSSIKKISVIDKPSIGFIQGQGEPPIGNYQQALRQLMVLYDAQPVNLTDTVNTLSSFKTLAIIAPADSFSDAQLRKLDDYLAQGGNLFIAYNHVQGDFQTMQGNLVNTNLANWLSQKGLSVENNFVVDQSAGTVGVRQQTGFMTFTRQIPFYYWPMVKEFPNEFPITKGLEQVILQFASSINFTGDTTLRFIPFLQSSGKSGTLSTPTYFNLQKQWGDNDFPLAGLTIGAILEGPIVGSVNSKIVLITDGDFAINGEGQNAQQQRPDNVSLLVNSIDWLSDDTGLIDLRTKEVTSRPLEEIDEGKRTLWKWVNFMLPIVLVIIYGIIRMQVRRNKRIKRMEAGYVS